MEIMNFSTLLEREARKIIKGNHNRKWYKEDLIQEGFIGLLEARESYDLSKSKSGFWGYACKFVSGRMINYIAQFTNQIRPSQKLNSIALKIKKGELINSSPLQIAQLLNCTVHMAEQALNFINIRIIDSLNQSKMRSGNSEDKQLIEVTPYYQNPDNSFKFEIMNSLPSLEQNIATMLIECYSIRDIMTHYKLTEEEIQDSLDKIVIACDCEYKVKKKRNEGWIMGLNKPEQDIQDKKHSQMASLKWVNIDYVIPNPKNARKDRAVKTKEMQDILSSKGWEEGITCYEAGVYFVILSGHRRWHAAKQIGKKVIPVYIVDAPQSDVEELDRISSVQGGQVEWSLYEQAKHTFNCWEASGKQPYIEIGKMLGISIGLVGTRIRVYQYYPECEIEDKLSNHTYSLTMLDHIYTWIKRLREYHSNLVDSVGEHIIRGYMLKKYENRCFNGHIATDKSFVSMASEQSILNFLTDMNKKLQDCLLALEIDTSKKEDITQNRLKIHGSINVIKKMKYHSKKEAESILSELDKLLAGVNSRITYLRNYN